MPNGLEEFLDDAAEEIGLAPDLEYTISEFTIGEGWQKRAGVYGGSRCTETAVLNICGSAKTGKEGERVLNLEDFICIAAIQASTGSRWFRQISAPIYFVATPISNTPALLTFTIDIQDQDTEPKFRIKVFSWDANGRPNRDIVFNWHCCVNTVLVSSGEP
jgi:hypothetical protein